MSPTMIQKASMPPKALRRQRELHTHDLAYLQSPLSNLSWNISMKISKNEATYRNSDESKFAKTVLHGSLKRIRTAKLRINDNQLNSPINLKPN